jgi:hypothetical protein
MAKVPVEMIPAFDKASRIIMAELKQQAPVAKDGKNKGDLKRSVKVVPYYRSTTDLGFEITADEYGTYLDMGTGTYRAKERGKYEKNPGKGKGGIRPRFWLSLSDGTKIRVSKILTEAAKQYLKRAFQKNG